MFSFLFWGGVAALVVVLVSENIKSKARSRTDYTSMSYRQGYWDGVRASEAGQVSSADANQYQEQYGAPQEYQYDQPTAYATESTTAQPVVETEAVESQPVQDVALFEADTTDSTVETEPEQPEARETTYVDATPTPQYEETYAPSIVSSRPRLSEAERKERNRNHTINIALYSASLLLVSGILLLTQTLDLPGLVRLILVWLLVTTFYVVGIMLERKVKILRPAALAFVGTALASVPFVGIAMYQMMGGNAAFCWLLTSFLGTILYVHSAVKLKSRLLGYVSMVSIFAFVCSVPAVAQAQIMWYYVLIIAYGSALTLLAHYKFSWIPRELAIPISQFAPVFAPGALVASLFSFAHMSPIEYATVFAAAAVFYLVEAIVRPTDSLKQVYWVVSRVLMIVTVGYAAAGMTDSAAPAIGYAVCAAALVNVLVSAFSIVPKVRNLADQHEIMLWVGFVIALISLGITGKFWDTGHAFVLSVQLAALAAVSLVTMMRLGRSEFGWFGLVAVTVLPLLVGGYIATPQFDTTMYATIYMSIIVFALLARWACIKRAIDGGEAALLYTAALVWLTISTAPTAIFGGWWAPAWWLLAAGIALFVVFVERVSWAITIAHGALLVTAGTAMSALHLNPHIINTVGVWLNIALGVGAVEVFRRNTRYVREASFTSVMLPIYATLGGLLTFSTMSGDHRWLAMFAWSAVAVAYYYVAWRRHAMGLVAIANTAVVVLVSFVAWACQLSTLTHIAVVAWVVLVGFVAVSYAANRNGFSPALARTWWVVGTVAAVVYGLAALFGGMLSPVDGTNEWIRIAAWLAAVVALYIIAYLEFSVAILYLANATAVIAGLLITQAFDLSAMVSWGILAWAFTVLFIGACYHPAVTGRASRTMWVSGVLVAGIFGGLAYLGGIGVEGTDVAWRAAAWAATVSACYLAAYRSKQTTYLAIGNITFTIFVSLLAAAFGLSTMANFALSAWIPFLLFLVASQVVPRGQAHKVWWVSGVASAVVFGVFALLGGNVSGGDMYWRLSTWLAATTAIYTATYLTQQVWSLYVANGAYVVFILMIAHIMNLGPMATATFVAWLSLVAFVAISQIEIMNKRKPAMAQAFWLSGTMIAIWAGLFALLTGGGAGLEKDEAFHRITTWLAATIAMYYIAWSERSLTGLVFSNAGFVILVSLICTRFKLPYDRAAAIVAWVSFATFYVAGQYYSALRNSRKIWNTMFWSAQVVMVGGGLIAAFSGHQGEAIAGSLALIVAGLAFVYDDYTNKRVRYLDLGGIIATVGLHRAIYVYAPDVHYLVFTHLWAALWCAIAYRYYMAGYKGNARLRLVIALLLLTVPAFVAAQQDNSVKFQVLFLIEHALMVVIGLVRAYRMATYWGAIGVTLAILYMLRGFTSLLTIAIGLMVIAAVVWVIVRANKKDQKPKEKPTTHDTKV